MYFTFASPFSRTSSFFLFFSFFKLQKDFLFLRTIKLRNLLNSKFSSGKSCVSCTSESRRSNPKLYLVLSNNGELFKISESFVFKNHSREKVGTNNLKERMIKKQIKLTDGSYLSSAYSSKFKNNFFLQFQKTFDFPVLSFYSTIVTSFHFRCSFFLLFKFNSFASSFYLKNSNFFVSPLKGFSSFSSATFPQLLYNIKKRDCFSKNTLNDVFPLRSFSTCTYSSTLYLNQKVGCIDLPEYIDELNLENKIKLFFVPIMHSHIYGGGGSGEEAASFIRIAEPKSVFVELCRERYEKLSAHVASIMTMNTNSNDHFSDEVSSSNNNPKNMDELLDCNYSRMSILPRIHGGFLYAEFKEILMDFYKNKNSKNFEIPNIYNNFKKKHVVNVIPIDRCTHIQKNRLYEKLLYSKKEFEGFLGYAVDSVLFRKSRKDIRKIKEIQESLNSHSTLTHNILVEERSKYMAAQVCKYFVSFYSSASNSLNFNSTDLLQNRESDINGMSSKSMSSSENDNSNDENKKNKDKCDIFVVCCSPLHFSSLKQQIKILMDEINFFSNLKCSSLALNYLDMKENKNDSIFMSDWQNKNAQSFILDKNYNKISTENEKQNNHKKICNEAINEDIFTIIDNKMNINELITYKDFQAFFIITRYLVFPFCFLVSIFYLLLFSVCVVARAVHDRNYSENNKKAFVGSEINDREDEHKFKPILS